MNLEALEKINDLKNKGVLSDAEFQVEKAKILNQSRVVTEVSTRPKSPKVLGIISIILSISELLRIPLGLNKPSADANTIYLIEVIALGLLMYIPMLISGIGFVQYKNIGRKLTVIMCSIGIAIILLAWFGWLVKYSKGSYNSYEESTTMGMAFGGWLEIVYPIILIIFASKKPFKESLS
jgi:hypothetical protein